MTATLYPINDMAPGRRFAFDEAKQRAQHPDVIEKDFWENAIYCWPYTVLGIAALYNYYSALKFAEAAGLEGAVIECGVFMGGSALFAGRLLKDAGSTRRLIAMDTFYGFVRNDPEKDVNYSGTVVCKPNKPENDFSMQSMANMRASDYARLEMIKGDVFETIPALQVDKIAVLRLDTDTYDTTKFELEQFYPRMVSGGVVIIDDYGFNQGCAEAVNEYLAKAPVFIPRIDRFVRSFQKP
jgi:O-methyltransferase